MADSKFDDLLRQLGTGRWNLLVFIAVGYWNMHVAPNTLSGAFVTPAVNYTCEPPNHAYTLASSAALGHPRPAPATFLSLPPLSLPLPPPLPPARAHSDECHYYSANSSSSSSEVEGGFYKESCQAWSYDNATFSHTITSQFDLVCGSEYLRATYQSMYMFGTLFGAPLTGFLSDKFGRKTMMVLGVLTYFTVSLGSCWLPHFSAILAFRFILGFIHPAVLQTGFILAMEVCEPRHRSTLGILLALPWAVGTMAWGGAAYLIRDWRWLQLAVNLSSLLLFPVIWFLDESPRWLIVHGHSERARRVMARAAAWNKTTLPPDDQLTQIMVAIQRESTLGQKAQRQQQHVEDAEEAATWRLKARRFLLRLLILFRTPRLRLITIFVSIKFFLVSLIFYGIALNAVNYSADPFVYMVLSGLAEVPAYTLTAPVIAKLGRKWPSVVLYVFTGVVIIAVAFIPAELQWLVMMLVMMGKMCISAAFQVLYLYSVELFPTEVRLRALGFATILSRIGSIISPFITDLLGPVYPWAPSLVFGLGALLAGLATVPLSETLGTNLPDTITELEHCSHAQRNFRSEDEHEETELAKLRA